jgi:poly(hydroxyalkanoate) depolymerase family esterase
VVARARRPLALVFAALLVGAPTSAAMAAGTFVAGTHEGRAYRLWVPTPPGAAGPLIVALHGCWQTPEDLALGTRLNEAAERRGLLVLYPAQGRADNPYRCWNWFEPTNQTASGAESSAVLGLMRHVQRERGVREARAIVLGFSAGGFMAVNLVCVAPQLFAGVGVAAGGPFRCGVGPQAAIQCMRGATADAGASASACVAAGGRPPALRASLWHGALDTVVSPANLGALETMFARVLGMTSALTEARDGAVRSIGRDARNAPVLETWLIAAMGHAWSGGDARGTHTFPPGPSATERMLEFLLAPAPPAPGR